LKQTTAQATSTNAKHRPNLDPTASGAAVSSSARTATARPSTNGAKPRRRFDSASGDPRSDPTSPRPGPVGSAVVPLGGVDLARSFAPPWRRHAGRRNVIEDGCEHGGVGGGQPLRSAAAHRRPRPGGACSQACQDRLDLCPRGSSRVARTLMVSTLARDQSTRPCSPSGSRPRGGGRRTSRPLPTR
jgi:hypothetical protein